MFFFFLEKKETETEMCLNAFTRITGNIKANTPKNYTKRFLSYDFSIKKKTILKKKHTLLYVFSLEKSKMPCFL